ncbi:MAG: hypothetical protein WD648_00750 [Planctomycetaceae bacterium]
MNFVQFDEDVNASHLAQACISEGKVTPKRFPRHWCGSGIKDSQVISELIPRGNLILTSDLRFAEDWIEFVPDAHPGIAIIGLDEDDVRTATTHIIQSILAAFKADVPGWHLANWRNSIVIIRPRYIDIGHCESRKLVQDDFIDRQSADWIKRLSSKLDANSSRSTIC